MPQRLSKRILVKCEKYIYMLVSNISVVYFRFETWIKGWQSINTFVSINVVFLVGFSPSVGRSQLWDNSRHNSGCYAWTAKLRQLCWLLRHLCWGSYAKIVVLAQICWDSCVGAAMLRQSCWDSYAEAAMIVSVLTWVFLMALLLLLAW